MEVVRAVVTDASGPETFWEQETSFVASVLEPVARAEDASFATPVEAVCVRAVTLDDFCAGRGLDPDVMKVDVEGSEASVLRGARRLLAARRATLFVEVHDAFAEAAGGSADAVFAELEAAGWRWTEVDADAPTRHFVCAPG